MIEFYINNDKWIIEEKQTDDIDIKNDNSRYSFSK